MYTPPRSAYGPYSHLDIPHSIDGYQQPPATIVRSPTTESLRSRLKILKDNLEDLDEKTTNQNSNRDRRIMDLEAKVHKMPQELDRIVKHNNDTTSTRVVREIEAKTTAMIAEKLDAADAAIADTNSALRTKMKDMMDAMIKETVLPRTTKQVLKYVKTEAIPQIKQESKDELMSMLSREEFGAYLMQGVEAAVQKMELEARIRSQMESEIRGLTALKTDIQADLAREEVMLTRTDLTTALMQGAEDIVRKMDLGTKLQEQLDADMRAKLGTLEIEMKAELTTAFGTASRGSASYIRRKVEEDLRAAMKEEMQDRLRPALRMEIKMELQEEMEAKFNELGSGMALRIGELEDHLALAMAQSDDVVLVERE
ncbi:hypothetical protein LTR47_002534 [Exophiala xenobiotica]|nr:hypothetical protein LTR47_002534 [Exophiala xenobiotica]KAK5247670.1 hypothetical protein LTS06_007169 [Exophiala xenobiotica]KAK5350693.1 hypothetical protein LTR61_005890 [Exophiala xenobiotica]KAK5377893.1 hypothetical protein LTS03_004769 [Exophiala xenobiotica]KAK5389310.1 hypothetical protein LTR11_000120 [Exophiala xenobiotica]